MSRILIIDDEKELAQLLHDELAARGHEVLTRITGMTAWRLPNGSPT